MEGVSKHERQKPPRRCRRLSLLIGNSLVGVNTFTEGYGGLVGDYGGGVTLNEERDWIGVTTELTVPEPSNFPTMMIGAGVLYLGRRKRPR